MGRELLLPLLVLLACSLRAADAQQNAKFKDVQKATNAQQNAKFKDVQTATNAQQNAKFKDVQTATKMPLKACLEKAGVHTVTGVHPDYDKGRRTLSKFSDNFPVAVVYPTSTEQVQAVVKCGSAARVKVLPRCGNHGNEGETVETGAITLDMQKMNSVQVSKDHNTAWVQGGAHMGKFLAEVIRVTNGTRGFPSGVRPTVGLAGFVLGGGFGGFTRYAGLGADNLIGIKGVDANGNTIAADKDQNPELLWASRGAGGGKFVVVTDFHLRLMDVTPGITNFEVVVPENQAVDAMMFYQTWAPTLPATITHRANVRRSPGSSKPTFVIGGRYMGPIEEAKKALIASGLHDSKILHVDDFQYKHTDYLKAVIDGIGFALPNGPDEFTVLSDRKYWEFEYAWSYKYRSLIINKALPREAFELALEFGQLPGTEFEVQALTGYVSTVPRNSTAVGHLRDGLLVIVLRGTKEPSNNKVTSEAGMTLPKHVEACIHQSHDEVLHGNANATHYVQKIGALVPEVRTYINFRDTDLPTWTPDYLEAYHGSQLPALECVKLKHDPSNLFSMPMDVRPPIGSAAHCPELLNTVGKAAANYSRYLLASGPARSGSKSSVSTPKLLASTVTEAGQKSRQASPAGSKAAGRKLAHHFSWLYHSA